jgi:hypothetical protein
MDVAALFLFFGSMLLFFPMKNKKKTIHPKVGGSSSRLSANTKRAVPGVKKVEGATPPPTTNPHFFFLLFFI